MTESEWISSDLEADPATHAAEVFSVLDNETRLSILLQLWEAFDPREHANAVPFSELRERVGMRDSGQFNYHLDKLTGHFIEQTDDGYVLTRAGLSFVQSVVAGSAIRDPEVGPVEIDATCPRCGAPVTVRYDTDQVTVACTECPGFFHSGPYEDGTIIRFGFPPAGLGDRSPEEVVEATFAYQLHRVESMMDGVCPTCGGRADTWLDVCEAHDPDRGVCEECGTPFIALVRWGCRTCKAAFNGPSWASVMNHPAVIAFFYDHGIEHQHASWDTVHRGYACEEELLSSDPLRLRITVRIEDDSLRITLDEGLNVIDVDEDGLVSTG